MNTPPSQLIESVRPRETGRRTISAAVAALERLHNSIGDAFDRAADTLSALEGKVVTMGVGKSGFAAQKVAATLRSVGLPAVHLSAAESLHGDLGVVCNGDVAMLFSKSGVTPELLAVLPHLRARGVIIVAVVGSASSPLALESDIVLDASVEREGCPLDAAPMASVVVAQAIGDALAAAVVRARGFTTDDFARLHPAGALGARLTLTVQDVMRRGDELPLVATTAGLIDAVIEITRTGYGAVCVLGDDGCLAGFLTDGDIRRTLLKLDGVRGVGGVGVAEVMTRGPLTLAPELPLADALLKLERRRKAVMAAPVVVDGRCVGLLRLHDVVRAHLPA